MNRLIEQHPVREWMRTLHRLQPYRTARALWLALASALILSVVMVLGAVTPATHRLEPGYHAVYTTVAYLLLFTLLYLYNFWIIRCGLKDLRLILAGLGGSLALAAAFAALQWWLESLLYGASFNNYTITLIIDASAALIAYLISLLLTNVTLHQQTLLENEHLQAENLRIRHETLEQQLSPHFLFNSLNTLDGLIGVDNDAAHRYLHALADNFRYSLAHSDTVSLEQELQFTHNYIDMMQMRYGSDALRIEEHIPPELLGHRLPPISLQLVVENAVKHNVATQRHPLTIEITADGGSLKVSNPKQPKAQQSDSAGIGLANLSGRYNLLFHNDIAITDTDDCFSVRLPLINN